nr:hypothetical protein [uncultured Desulfobacter sp.]
MNIPISKQKKQLELLIQALEHLCTHLRVDKDCPWTDHFERQLNNAMNLFHNGFTQDDLNSLSSSVRSVYGGMGSFNDYYNPNFTKQRNKIIEQIGSSLDLSEKVYEYALELKVIGRISG